MDSITLNDLIENGFSIRCLNVRQAFGEVEMFFKLSHNDYDSIYFRHWLGDKDYRMTDSMNSILDGTMQIRLNNEMYVELKDLNYSEIYEALFEYDDYEEYEQNLESEQMKKSNQTAITILKSVFK